MWHAANRVFALGYVAGVAGRGASRAAFPRRSVGTIIQGLLVLPAQRHPGKLAAGAQAGIPGAGARVVQGADFLVAAFVGTAIPAEVVRAAAQAGIEVRIAATAADAHFEMAGPGRNAETVVQPFAGAGRQGR